MKISKRKDRNLYYANVKLPTGSYKKIYGKTKREVREKYDELTTQVKTGEYVKHSNITFGEWYELWKKNYCLNIKETTMITYNRRVSNHVLPFFKSFKVQDIKPYDVQQFIQKTQEAVSPKTAVDCYMTLHRILNDAVKAEIIIKNPADNATLPKLEKKEMTILNEKEVAEFLNYAYELYPKYADIFEFILLTGLRVGELAGLTFDRYDRENKTILIDRQFSRMITDFDTPKFNVVRTIYLPDRAVDIIERRLSEYEHFKSLNIEGFIFTNDNAGYTSQSWLNVILKRVSKHIGKPELRIHDLRHTYATLALKSGMDIKTLQITLGHSSSAFTLDRYGHSTEEMKKEAVNNFGDMFDKLLTQN